MHKNLRIIIQSLVGVIILLLVVKILFPYCQYFIDTDATAYIQLTKNFAAGDFYKGMSGLWNPLHSMLAAWTSNMFHWSVYDALLYTNLFGAALTILTSIVILNKFISTSWMQWLHAAFLGVFWGINAYYQLTSDVLGVLGLNLYLLVLFKNQDLKHWGWNIVLGLILAVSCLAKTYSFYIEVLLLIIWVGKLVYERQFSFKTGFIRLASVGIVNLLVLLPWIFAFYNKYNVWNVSLAGKYNMSSRVKGTTNYREDIQCLVPPSHEGALSFWEDPHWLQGDYIGVFDNAFTVKRYILRLGYNVIEWTTSISHLSIFWGFIWLLSVIIFCSKRMQCSWSDLQLLIMLHIAVFPVGLWLVHIESRYMWYCMPLVWITGLLLTEKYIKPSANKYLYLLSGLFFMSSFIVGPVHNVKEMVNVGKAEYEMAQQIEALNLPKGSFFTNVDFGTGRQPEVLRLASFLQQPVYIIEVDSCSMEHKLEEAKMYGIDYYLHYTLDPLLPAPTILNGFPEVTRGRVAGVHIYQLKP